MATRRVAIERLQALSIYPNQLQPARCAGRARHEENPLTIGGNLCLVDGLIRDPQNLRFYPGYDIIPIEGCGGRHARCCALRGDDVDKSLMTAQSERGQHSRACRACCRTTSLCRWDCNGGDDGCGGCSRAASKRCCDRSGWGTCCRRRWRWAAG